MPTHSLRHVAPRIWPWALAATLTAHAATLWTLSGPAINDWNYFNALSLVVRSAVFGYETLPIHNPWICGGVDILVNPQNRLFSPTGLLDLAFSPPVANTLFLMVHAFVGFIGMAKLLGRLGVDRSTSLLGAALFLHGSWFGLHFAEGHIPFATMQLLPAAMYLATRAGSPRHLILLGLTFGWMLLDGGIYAAIYTILAGATFLAIGLVPRSEISKIAAIRPAHLAVVALGSLLVALPKIVPVLLHMGERLPLTESEWMSVPLLARALLHPLQAITDHDTISPTPTWGFHEYGCYLSPIAIGTIVFVAFRTPSIRRAMIGPFAALLFWLWAGTGLLTPLNPWVVFQKLPFVNNAHVQSRLLVIAFLFFVVLLAIALGSISNRPSWFALLSIVVVTEAIVVRNHPGAVKVAHDGLVPHDALEEAPPGRELITSTSFVTAPAVLWTPSHYLAGRYGSTGCYDRGFQSQAVRGVGTPDYRGEAYPLDPEAGRVRLARYIPGEITLDSELKEPSPIEINTNALWGWMVAEGDARLAGYGAERLLVLPSNDRGRLVLRYRPLELPWLIASLMVGLLMLWLVWRRIEWPAEAAPAGASTRFDYSSFPPGFYDQVIQGGSPVRRAWHLQKFRRVLDGLPDKPGTSLLDIGCFAGTFLSMADVRRFPRQLGVDILPEQIAYAREHYANEHRQFRTIGSLDEIGTLESPFDAITLIEVIEHLEAREVSLLLDRSHALLANDGTLVITTPNYASAWPMIELLVNALSEVSYEEQHITRFNAFSMIRQLRRIHPHFDEQFEVDFQATTHFIAPFVAALSPSLSDRLSTLVRHERWWFPFGQLILLRLRKRPVGPA